MKCVISGSFHKFYDQIARVIGDFEKSGITVLAPQISKVKNPNESFAILESDETTDPKLLEQDHLDAIKQADFLFVYNQLGYVGLSTSLEIGYALALGKPVYTLELPSDTTIAALVEVRDLNSFAAK